MGETWLIIRNHRYVLLVELLSKLLLGFGFLGLSVYASFRAFFDVRNGGSLADSIGAFAAVSVSAVLFRSLGNDVASDSEDI